MLGCTCTIHLRIQCQRCDAWDIMVNINMECSRVYAQHFQLYFHVFQSFMLNRKCKYSRAPKSFPQHKTYHRSCASGSTPNTKHFINHVLQGPCPTQNIYIINNWLTPNIQNKSSCSYALGSSTQYKIKHQYNHHDQ